LSLDGSGSKNFKSKFLMNGEGLAVETGRFQFSLKRLSKLCLDSSFVGFGLNVFVAEAVAFGVERLGEPLIGLLIGMVRAGMVSDALHDYGLSFLRDCTGFEEAGDGGADCARVVLAKCSHGGRIVLIGGETQESVAVRHGRSLTRRQREPFLESGYGAKSFGVYFPGDTSPEHRDAIGQTVHAHTVFRICRRLLQPQYSSIFRFFYVNETIHPCDILKCFEFLHGNFSLRRFTRGAC
jgi:hypothetical protein